ncbi:hypothetical protein [Actinoplanes sp. NPDC049118]|uniref:hypothetical protein n=1 Tax=Actinoplanes sp. NPDC049118 TaxID=3155769 RepID=UPI00340A7398
MTDQFELVGAERTTVTARGAREWKTRLFEDGTVEIQLLPDHATPGTALRIGFHPTPADYKLWLSKLPTPWFTRVFHSGGKGLPAYTGNVAISGLPAGTIRHISYKDRVAPAAITAFLDSIPAGTRVWLTWYHEGDIDWAGDVDGYVGYWKLLRETVDAHPARPYVTLINVHTLYASRYKRREMDWRRFMVPDLADVDSWDCYRPASVDAYEAPETLLGLPIAARREFGVRTHITEFGTHPTRWDTDGTWQAAWYREACAYLDGAGVEAVGFWCNADGQFDYRPTKPRVLEEWRSLMNQYNAKARIEVD